MVGNSLDHMIPLPCLAYQLKNKSYETSRVELYKQQISHQVADDGSPAGTQNYNCLLCGIEVHFDDKIFHIQIIQNFADNLQALCIWYH